MMQHRIKTITLLKCLLCLYIITLVFTFSRLHDANLQQTMQQAEDALKSHQNRTMTAQNVTKIVYLYKNRTIYVNNTREKVVRTSLSQRYGPGENGVKVKPIQMSGDKLNLTEMELRKKFHGFDTLISDVVSLHRKLPDFRPSACREKVYPTDMPSVSVVIIFRNEWPSIVLRTAYSVLEMSPPELLKEVVLVDDGSTDADLIAKIDLHVANVNKLKLVRNKMALGLMMARQRGIESTTTDYFIVIDGHMEVAPGWLEPLVYRLVQEPNAILCSHIGVIRGQNLEAFVDMVNFDNQFPFFDPLTLGQLWGWFRPDFITARNKSIEPIPYGTLQGMMIVMRKTFFLQLGGFDPGMKVWGSEQMELSVKVWLCGGRVEMIPCSKVVHMYRQTPWGKPNKTSNFILANRARMIGVWMDPPYSDYIYDTMKVNNISIGDLSERLRIRKENNCKPYQFFVDTVKQFSNAYMAEDPKEKGSVYSVLYKKCIDCAKINDTDKLILYNCHGMHNQYFLLTEHNEIRTTEGRILQGMRADGNSTKLGVVVRSSPSDSPAVKWDYQDNGRIYHTQLKLCLDAITAEVVGLVVCSDATSQLWEWGYHAENK